MQLFSTEKDFAAFEEVLQETLECRPMRLCAYCLMPNHWHLLLWPEADGDLAAFMQRLTVTHAARWQQFRHRSGQGHVYQGRFKSFPIQTDEYFYHAVRYVERNATAASLVDLPDAWRWSSLWRFVHGSEKERSILSPWPVARPDNWLAEVRREPEPSELAALRECTDRGRPYGETDWVETTCNQLGLKSTMRPRGRPGKFK